MRENQHINQWAIGDQIPIQWNGTVGILDIQGTHYGKLMDMNYLPNITTGGNKNILVKTPYTQDGTQLAFCDSRYNNQIARNAVGLCMNPYYYIPDAQYSTKGGWKECFANVVLMDQFFIALPADLRTIVAQSTIYTDNVGNGTGSIAGNVTVTPNEVFFLAEMELFGLIKNANTYEADYQCQVHAYANGLDKMHYKHSSQSTAAHLILRSPSAKAQWNFTSLSNAGDTANRLPSQSIGMCPCFMVA